MPRKLLALSLLCILGYGLYHASGVLLFAFRPADPQSSEPMIIEIQKGDRGSQIARKLESGNIITSSRKLLRLGQLLGKWKQVKAGEYEVSPQMTPIEVFAVITSGVSISYPITVKEGENIYQIAEQLVKKNLAPQDVFLGLCKNKTFIRQMEISTENHSPPSLEGYLFPDTYHFNHSMSAEQIIQTMISRFKKEWKPEWNERSKRLKLSRHQVITLASIIEKETGAPEERSMISSVFHNRLTKKMRLQSDPTTIYGIWTEFGGNLRRHHLKEKNSYNTYAIRGLPIGPIANPGTQAIEAALYPKDSEYLYFVSRNDGTHEFTKTFKAHSEAVRKYQLDQKAREGKSWRDLHRRKESEPRS